MDQQKQYEGKMDILLNDMVRDRSEMLNRFILSTKKELELYFSVEEEMLIVATFNGFFYNPMHDNKKVLLYEVEDSINLEGFDKLYGVNKGELIRKIIEMSEFQAFTMVLLSILEWE